jgi:two-component system invasion response regulator UvrY
MEKIKIALAEEYPIFRQGLRSTINSFEECIVVVEAEDGQQLLDYFTNADELPDICIFDISLPVINGYEALKDIKRRWPQLKVLILSMTDSELSIIRMIKIGANGILMKECNPTELHKALLSIHNEGIYYKEAHDRTQLDKAKNSIALQLSYSEMEFMSLCCTDMNYKAIADAMRVSTRTVDSYRNTLYKKLKVNSRIGIVLFALNIGMLSRKG